MTRELDAYAVWDGIEAEFCAGFIEGRNLDTPEPSANRHPAYRHSWEVGRAEAEGRVIPYAFSLRRAAEIESGGEFYPYAKSPSQPHTAPPPTKPHAD